MLEKQKLEKRLREELGDNTFERMKDEGKLPGIPGAPESSNFNNTASTAKVTKVLPTSLEELEANFADEVANDLSQKTKQKGPVKLTATAQTIAKRKA